MSHSDHAENRLARESSPYLLLHKSNPVDWYPWGEEALSRAREEEKPIFLSVGYSTCYWCHVMERESFSDEAVAELMNREFVNIKLDREERPDLDEIYMTATQVLTQHGGWPNSVFLTPDLKPFFAGTYFPPEDRQGMPGFRRVVHSMTEAWKNRRDDVREQAEGVSESIRRFMEERTRPSDRVPGAGVAMESFRALGQRFDARWGGFGGAPKFPTPANLLLLEEFVDSEPFAAQMLTETLDQMARGGIYDRLGGGFHRYATDDEWKIPHFEKMLYDNGLLLELYAREWGRNGDPEIERILRETVTWLDREMTADDGAFWSALDAETEGVEGAFYVWTADELRGVLGDEEYGFLASLYGFDVDPFFEGRHYVLHLPRPLAEQAQRRQMSLEEITGQVDTLRQRLLEARAQRQMPLTDQKVMADWNGMAIAGLAEAGRLLPDPSFVERASRAAAAVEAQLRPEGRLLHVTRGEQPPVTAFLSDYVYLVRGLLALHRAGAGERWLELAVDLTREQREHLEDPQGGFFVTEAGDDVLFRSKEAFDGATPAANSIAALNLIELAEVTGDSGWRDAAEQTLRGFTSLVEQLPDGARTMAVAARRFGGEDAAPTHAEPPEETPVSVTASWTGETGDEGWRPFEVVLDVETGWHLYSSAESTFQGVEIAADGELRGVELQPAERGSLELDGESIETWSGRVCITGELASSGTALAVRFQPCDDSRCLAPVTAEIEL